MPQEQVHCDECKRFLLSVWPQGSHDLVIATGLQPPDERDETGAFRGPGPMTTGGITFSRRDKDTILRVRCPECKFGGSDVIFAAEPAPAPRPRMRPRLWARVQAAWTALRG